MNDFYNTNKDVLYVVCERLIEYCFKKFTIIGIYNNRRKAYSKCIDERYSYLILNMNEPVFLFEYINFNKYKNEVNKILSLH